VSIASALSSLGTWYGDYQDLYDRQVTLYNDSRAADEELASAKSYRDSRIALRQGHVEERNRLVALRDEKNARIATLEADNANGQHDDEIAVLEQQVLALIEDIAHENAIIDAYTTEINELDEEIDGLQDTADAAYNLLRTNTGKFPAAMQKVNDAAANLLDEIDTAYSTTP